jgi:hypothetical protein
MQKSPLNALLLAILRNPRRSFWTSFAIGAAIAAGAFAASFHGTNWRACEIGLAVGGIWMCQTLVSPKPDERDIGGCGQMLFSLSVGLAIVAAGLRVLAAHSPEAGADQSMPIIIGLSLGFGAFFALGGIGYKMICRSMLLQEQLKDERASRAQ